MFKNIDRSEIERTINMASELFSRYKDNGYFDFDKWISDNNVAIKYFKDDAYKIVMQVRREELISKT